MDSQSERIIFQTEHPIEHNFKVSGALPDWQEHVGKPCEGNSRLVFGVSCAFAAPLIYPTGDESGGLHFYGHSSLGKTTLERVSGSVCGGSDKPLGYLVPWRATANGLEAVAAVHSDMLLCLDEIAQVATREVGEVVYMITGGSGKQRARRDGSGRPPSTWRTLFQSSGEVPLSTKIAEDGHKRVTGGQQVRLVDIPADAGAGFGIFEDLHDHASGRAFADYLRDATSRYYGTAIRAYMRELVPKLDPLKEAIEKSRKTFVDKYCPSGADGQVFRVASRFGLVAAAGELGVALDIVPWEEEHAMWAAGSCFNAWLTARPAGKGPAETAAMLAQVRRFLEMHGEARFTLWELDTLGKPNQPTINRAGVRRHGDGGWHYYIFPEVYKSEICAGFDPREVTKLLVERNYLVAGADGKNLDNPRLPSIGRVRVYHFAPAILTDDANE